MSDEPDLLSSTPPGAYPNDEVFHVHSSGLQKFLELEIPMDQRRRLMVDPASAGYSNRYFL